jgi:hypothetical protein
VTGYFEDAQLVFSSNRLMQMFKTRTVTEPVFVCVGGHLVGGPGEE